ncbi:hypothetical protein Nizo2814_2995 [Lactiplantibacillus plantarum]|nr:hypothetical protein Nizo2814_2995 [Lactiplantibacillus plantarum]
MNAQHKLAYQGIKTVGSDIHGVQATLFSKPGLSRSVYNKWLHHESIGLGFSVKHLMSVSVLHLKCQSCIKRPQRIKQTE